MDDLTNTKNRMSLNQRILAKGYPGGGEGVLCKPARSNSNVGRRICGARRHEPLLPSAKLSRQHPAGLRIASDDHPRIANVANTGDHLLKLLNRLEVGGIERHHEHNRIKAVERFW